MGGPRVSIIFSPFLASFLITKDSSNECSFVPRTSILMSIFETV